MENEIFSKACMMIKQKGTLLNEAYYDQIHSTMHTGQESLENMNFSAHAMFPRQASAKAFE